MWYIVLFFVSSFMFASDETSSSRDGSGSTQSPIYVDHEDRVCRMIMKSFYRRDDIAHSDMIMRYLKEVIRQREHEPHDIDRVMTRIESGDLREHEETDMALVHEVVNAAISRAFEDYRISLEKKTQQADRRISKRSAAIISVTISSLSSLIVGLVVNFSHCK